MVQLRARGVERGCDRLLDACLVLLAAWTVSYHVCLVLRLGLWWALAFATVLAAATVVLLLRSPAWADAPALPAEDGRLARSAQTRRALAWSVAAATLVGALAMALEGPWLLVWLPWLLAAGAGAAWAAASPEADPPPGPRPASGDVPDAGPAGGAGTAALVLAWAGVAALLSLLLLKPNPDDVFYLNLSQWVSDHGAFPLRDTLFADRVYPMTNWPPVASYDALVGAVAHLTGAYAATIAYVYVTPVASALSVLALWRLLRAWRVPSVAVAISVALVFLLTAGDLSYASPANLFVSRLWQGKVILLCVAVPLLLVQSLRYVARPSRAGLLRLAVVGIASVGLSTTAIFLTPAVALAGMAPLALRSPRRAAAGFAALATYALGAGVVTLAVGGHSADDFGARKLYRFEAEWIGHEIFRSGPVAFAAVTAVLLAPLLLPRRASRVTTAVASLVTGLVLVPGLVHLSYDVSGLGPTLWRLSWGLTIAALVGVAASWGADRLSRAPALARARRGPWAVWAVGLVTVLVLASLGRPPWSSGPSAQLSAPFHWQRPPGNRTMAARVLAATRPGDLVAAPKDLSTTLAITSTDVWTVAPATYYLAYLEGQPGFHAGQRRIVARFVNDIGKPRPATVRRALRVLQVDIVCVKADSGDRYGDLRRFGFTPVARSTDFRCLRRP